MTTNAPPSPPPSFLPMADDGMWAGPTDIADGFTDAVLQLMQEVGVLASIAKFERANEDGYVQTAVLACDAYANEL